MIENLGISKKILRKNDRRDIIKLRMRYKITAHFERLKTTMAMNYDKLWKMLIDKKMNRTELHEQAHVSTNAIATMPKRRVQHPLISFIMCLQLRNII